MPAFEIKAIIIAGTLKARQELVLAVFSEIGSDPRQQLTHEGMMKCESQLSSNAVDSLGAKWQGTKKSIQNVNFNNEILHTNKKTS